MHSLNRKYLDQLKFSSAHISTLKTIGECRGKQALFSKQTPEALESLKEAAIIESSESSNRLEGIVAPHHRIEALVLKSATPRNRSEQEIMGYRDALSLIHESAPHMELSVNVILQIHSMVHRYMSDTGGKWKMTDNQIVERNPDGTVNKVRFDCVSAVATPQAMTDLVSFYKDDIFEFNTEPLVVVPLAILDFLCIHPFSDGNGRVARLLTLLLLYHFDYQVGRYISLERIFEKSKESYYETLELSSQGWHDGTHDVFPWMTYFWGTLLGAYREFEERVGTITKGRGNKSEQVKTVVSRKIGLFTISDIESACPGVSRDMIRIVLRQLKDEGVIELRGKGRGARWLLKSR